MSIPGLAIAVTCVRVPVLGGHGESVNVETERSMTVERIREVLRGAQGICVLDDPKNGVYPTPQLSADKDEVFVGRIRLDDSVVNGAHLWIVSDNVRKGAATNAVQIAEELVKRQAMNFDPVESW